MHGCCAWPRLRSLLNTIFRSEAYYWPESKNEQHITFAAEVLLCISYALDIADVSITCELVVRMHYLLF